METQKLEMELELLCVEKLKEEGYPQDAILTEWQYKNYRFDIAVVDVKTQLPLMIIECKRAYNKSRLESAINQLRKYCNDFDYPVRACVALYTGNGTFDYYDVTETIKDTRNRIEDLKAVGIPPYEAIRSGSESRLHFIQKNNKKKYINGLRWACWLIIPLLAVTLGILDALCCYKLTTERLILFGIILISLLLPFFGEIKIGELTFSQKEKDGEEKNV